MVSNEAATMLVAASVQEVTNHVTSLGDADQVRFFRKELNPRNKRMKEAEINMRAQGRPLSTPKATKFMKSLMVYQNPEDPAKKKERDSLFADMKDKTSPRQ